MQENITAISTPQGIGGVAIIRISGGSPLPLALKMFAPSGKKAESIIPNRMYPGKILCENFTDYGYMVYFAAPNSFTGEDVVEFHCHGGTGIARGVLESVIKNGARLAEAGEFTRRAFINGKLTLSSAEGLADMISAENLSAIRAGNMLYFEKFSGEVRAIQDILKGALAAVAAEIDYPEEDEDGVLSVDVRGMAGKALEAVNTLLSTYSVGKKMRDGVNVAICGKPNAGKSSILNSLLGYDKAIVSSRAGTTRDAVEGEIILGGVKYNLIDTAGIRKSRDELEGMGISRAKSIISSADVVLSVDDGSGEAELPETCAEVFKIFNKCDIARPSGEYDAVVSAATGEGMDKLFSLLSSAAGSLPQGGAYVTEKRHYLALERARASLENFLSAAGQFPADVVSADLTEAWSALGEITGETASEEIINEVFSKFCVGK